MAHFSDLTPFEYESMPSEAALREPRDVPDPWMPEHLKHLELERTAVNVGWLSPDRPYSKGETSEAFQVALFRLCQAQDPLCSRTKPSPISRREAIFELFGDTNHGRALARGIAIASRGRPRLPSLLRIEAGFRNYAARR
jgi:hypothetical protein